MVERIEKPALVRGLRLSTFSVSIAVSVALLTPSMTHAQDVPAPQEEAASTHSQEVLVTGSRIVSPDYAQSNPVTSIDASAIVFSGTTNLTEFLRELPALTGSWDRNTAVGPQTFIGGTGLELLNLRNLGVQRTLVLVDGRRHVAALPGTAAVDVDTIPIGLIERIDIQTGGISAVYGADAVSGVVNFIMKKNFEGFDVSSQFGQSGHGDADRMKASAVGGLNFLEGRGNVTMAVEFSRENRLRSAARNYAAGGRRLNFVDNPADVFADDPNVPDTILLSDIRYYDTARAGTVYTDEEDYAALFGDETAVLEANFSGNDTPYDFGTLPPLAPGAPPITPFYQQGGDGTPLDDYIGDLEPEEKRYTANLFTNFEVSPQLRFFGEAKFSRSDVLGDGQPTFDYFLYIDPEYAFLPPNIAAATNTADGSVLVSRDHFDLGLRGEDIQRETVRGVLGASGELAEGLRYEVSYVYGAARVWNFETNNRYNDRFAAALDAVIDPDTGQATCRSNLDPSAVPTNIDWQGWAPLVTLPGTWAGSFTPGPNSGCIPIDVFGDGAISQAAKDWITTDSLNRSKLQQYVGQAYLSGDTRNWLQLPAGNVAFALGAEWRKEASQGLPPLENRQGLTFGNVISPERGDYNVSEGFAEINIPLLKDQPFANRLAIEGAYRLSDYSTIGSASTWKTGVRWMPVEDLTLRGTLAEATRAPNITELFDPGGQTFELIDDPCDLARLDEGTSFRAANCVQLLSALGVADPDAFIDANSSAVSGTLRGNRDLSEEVADTKTLGIVLQPRFVPGLTLAVDWYDIELDSAINTATPEEAAEICVDLPTIENPFCELLTRETGTGAIVDFIQQPVNVAQFTTEGYDFSIGYRLDPMRFGMQGNWGVFDMRLVGNKLKELSFVNLPGAPADPDKGEALSPEWQAVFDVAWQRGPLYVNYGFSYFDETQRYTLQERANNPDIVTARYLDYDAKMVHDIHVRFGLSNGVSLYGGVNNFTDQEPDSGETAYPVSPVGRFFYVGARFDNF